MEAPVDNIATLEGAARDLAAAAKSVDGISEALKKIAKTARDGRNIAIHAGEELERFRKLSSSLAGTDIKGTMDKVSPVLGPMEEEASRQAEREVVKLLAAAESKLKEAGHTLSGHYPELTCGVLTLVIEKGAREVGVSVYYGPKLAKMGSIAGADLEKVVASVNDAYAELKAAVMPDDAALAALKDAWSVARLRKGEAGEPGNVPILDVLLELCFQRQGAQFKRNPVKASFAPYAQINLSYQLFLLRTRRIGDLDLTLGIATRDEVKSKASIWVPRNVDGEGVHYASLGFRRNA